MFARATRAPSVGPRRQQREDAATHIRVVWRVCKRAECAATGRPRAHPWAVSYASVRGKWLTRDSAGVFRTRANTRKSAWSNFSTEGLLREALRSIMHIVEMRNNVL